LKDEGKDIRWGLEMNLIITDKCNRSCPYCFARRKIQSKTDIGNKSTGPIHISFKNFVKCLEFLERNSRGKLKILGGEPTLHPNFEEMISYTLDSGFSIIVFTNGLWPRSVQKFFEKTAKTEKVNFIFNINEPEMQTARENSLQAESLRIAGNRGLIGFNIYREEFSLQFIPELINKFSLKKDVRLGLASPVFGGNNSHVATSRLRWIGKSLVIQLQELERQDVLGSFDCGIPLCMFEEEDIGRVFLSTSQWASLCGTGIDVGPDLSVRPCLPLNGLFNVNLFDFESEETLDAYFSERLAPFRNFGCRDECITCKYLLRKQCCGGCLARTMQSLQDSGDSGLLEKLELLSLTKQPPAAM
jgi:MoaA/NifB/PqqE/SkfB family radical SAM enzyme